VRVSRFSQRCFKDHSSLGYDAVDVVNYLPNVSEELSSVFTVVQTKLDSSWTTLSVEVESSSETMKINYKFIR
jgi:hypothetical protein